MTSLPTFIIIGAPRAGTTTLYHYLKQHPQVDMSVVKEPNFFLFDESRLRFCGPGIDTILSSSVTTFSEYRSLFAHTSASVIGEASTQYLYSAHAARQIRQRLPDVRLVAILRHPVDRAFSSYLHLVGEGNETAPTFEAALDQEPLRMRDAWWPHYFYREKGFYFRQLEPYIELFREEQLRIYFYDDLLASSQDLLRNVFEYLGVGAVSNSQVVHTHNAAGIPRSRLLHRLMTQPHPLKDLVKRSLSSERVDRLVSWGQKRNLRKPPMKPETRSRLLADYRQDILQLQEYSGRNLEHWLS